MHELADSQVIRRQADAALALSPGLGAIRAGVPDRDDGVEHARRLYVAEAVTYILRVERFGTGVDRAAPLFR